MAKNKHSKDHSKKDHQNTPSAQHASNESQIQEQLAHYADIAQHLYQSYTYQQAEKAIAPINEMPVEDQLTFLNALSRERNSDAASVLLAINMLTEKKEVRKEARRSLIRLESVNVYSRWTPPPAPSLIDAFNSISPFNDSLPLEQIVEEDEEDNGNSEDDEDFEDEDEDEAETAIKDFIMAWAEQEYDDAYELLASDSPLRRGLDQDAWVALRNKWAEQAEPESVKVEIGYRYETEQELENAPETDDDTTQELDAFWSLIYQDTPLDSSLPELPKATVAYPVTGRHWFWAAYTVVQEDGEWRIHSMLDKGAEAQRFSEDDLNQRIDEITEEVAEMPVNKIFAQLEQAEDEEDENEEDEEETEHIDLGDNITEQFEESYWFTVQALHYTDALIAHNPQEVHYYERGVSLAESNMDKERATAYFALLAERVPDQHDIALRAQALSIYRLLTEVMEDDEQEEEYVVHLIEQTEKVLRESLAFIHEAMDYMLLGKLLMNQEDRLDEAEQLYQQALAVAADSTTRAIAEMGLGDIAHTRDQLEDALRHLQRASELAPDLQGVWYKLGDAYIDLNQKPQAEHAYMRSIEFDPENEDAYAALATLWGEQGKRKQAIQILEKGIEANPESANLRGVLAIQYVDEHNYRKADQLLEEAEAFDPNAEIIQLARQIIAMIQAEQIQQEQQPQQRHSRHGKSKSHKHKKR